MEYSFPGGDGGDPRTVRVSADRIDGHTDVDLDAFGDVRLERGGALLTSDRMHYDQISAEATAEGKVRLAKEKDFIAGPKARLNLETWFGEFYTPDYHLERERPLRNDQWPDRPGQPVLPMTRVVSGSGRAESLQFEGENQYRLKKATYSSCRAADPDWYLRIDDLKLDYDREVGRGLHNTVVFKGVPVAYTPWIEFPLTGGRQSGFMPPTLGGTSSTGFDMMVPYYFNLAPNYDATLAPRWMSERGLQLGGEARYLMPHLNGNLRGEFLSDDKTAHKSRSLLSWKHFQDFGRGFSGAVDATEVSDKDYFADLSSKITSTSQGTLTQQGSLAYNNGAWLSGNVLVQRFQILNKTISEKDIPYDRLPQFTLQARQADFYGTSFVLPVEYTSFSHPTKVEGRRTVMYPQVSYPMQSSAFFLTPKAGLHVTRYALDRRTDSGEENIGRTVPIMSVDAGMVLERDVDWGGQAQIQTLEPRLYYVRSAYRDQSQIPVFDTSPADFNFAQIFSDNVYSGQDRIADANQMTVGLQSRLIASTSGEEWLRGALGQRFYFRDQRVTAPDETPRTGRIADLLGALSGRVYKDVWLESAVQYDPRDDLLQRSTTSLRYQPDFSKVASISYRFKRGEFRDLDLSAQWPVWQRWYGVGRYNRNLRDDRLTESIVGFEYKADCWVFRGVWQTLLNTKQVRNNSYFVQLEFNDFASLGSNPVNLLRRSVSGYGKINDPAAGDTAFGERP